MFGGDIWVSAGTVLSAAAVPAFSTSECYYHGTIVPSGYLVAVLDNRSYNFNREVLLAVRGVSRLIVTRCPV